MPDRSALGKVETLATEERSKLAAARDVLAREELVTAAGEAGLGDEYWGALYTLEAVAERLEGEVGEIVREHRAGGGSR